MELKDRFFNKVEITNTCWLWVGSIRRGGYGQFKMPSKLMSAHRAAYLMFNGPIASDKNVLHKCDTPNCVNPAHLFLGSHQDNVIDKVNKGRQAKRSSHGHAKLSENDIINIKKLRESGKTLKQIALQYQVHPNHIGLIIRGLRWGTK